MFVWLEADVGCCLLFFFFCKQKTANGLSACLVGSGVFRGEGSRGGGGAQTQSYPSGAFTNMV